MIVGFDVFLWSSSYSCARQTIKQNNELWKPTALVSLGETPCPIGRSAGPESGSSLTYPISSISKASGSAALPCPSSTCCYLDRFQTAKFTGIPMIPKSCFSKCRAFKSRIGRRLASLSLEGYQTWRSDFHALAGSYCD